MNLAEPIKITQRIAQELERLNIRYLVGGSLASSLHGVPRATQDADLVAEITGQHIRSLVTALGPDFYIDADMIREAIERQGSFNVIHLSTMFKVDVFILKGDDASQEEMSRREQYQVADDPEQKLFLASAEDVIIHKLFWYRSGGDVSERQWNDALGVVQVQGDRLDQAYLKRAAQQRGISILLDRLLQAAEAK